ncbi:hypothetical protein [Nocardia brasiliensis]|uniref:hypothetical protein n=1 Tax=Nocardia brasiliensis TaxID=37326 RepID=UPI002454AAFE|nr:hypothetical protein [Nocardia brasiliensis]
MTTPVRSVAEPAAIATTRILLSQIGITPTDLLTDTHPTPTFSQAIPQLRTTLTPGTPRTYNTHLRWLENNWPHRRLDEVLMFPQFRGVGIVGCQAAGWMDDCIISYSIGDRMPRAE